MTCTEIRERLNDFVDGDVAAATATAIREHVTTCAACAAELEALERLREVTASLERDVEPDQDLWNGIFVECTIGREGNERVLRWRPKWSASGVAWRAGLTAAVVLLVVVGAREFRARGGAGAGWSVTTIEGAATIGARGVAGTGTLRAGEWLETDAVSRARLDVANIGHVTVGPASAIRLKGSSEKEHRIELARGEVRAFIWAPPRLFFVETPSGVAEDLGCQYRLAVDAEGNGALEVTLGFVSFERDGREVIVPAGARCDLRANVGPGTPHEAEAGAELREALARVDFDAPRSGAVDAVLAAATKADAVTLWHLIPRAAGAERERVVDRLAAWVPLPERTTRDGVLALDARMLERWWEAMYPSWSHWN